MCLLLRDAGLAHRLLNLPLQVLLLLLLELLKPLTELLRPLLCILLGYARLGEASLDMLLNLLRRVCVLGSLRRLGEAEDGLFLLGGRTLPLGRQLPRELLRLPLRLRL